MGNLNAIFYFLNEKIMFKNHWIKSNHWFLRKNEVDIYGPPVFAPDYSAPVWTANMCVLSSMSILCILDFNGCILSVCLSMFVLLVENT